MKKIILLIGVIIVLVLILISQGAKKMQTADVPAEPNTSVPVIANGATGTAQNTIKEGKADPGITQSDLDNLKSGIQKMEFEDLNPLGQ